MNKLLPLLIAIAASLCPASSFAQEEEKVLNVFNWSDYIADDTIAKFEKETGIKVHYDVFDSNEILHAKLVAGRSGYDVVVPSSYWATVQAGGGLLKKLDKSQLPNLKNIDPDIQSRVALLDPGNQYLVDWLWGYVTVGINVDKVKAALGSMPMPANAWDLLFKPAYVSKLKSCGVSFLDSPTDVIPAALHYLGKPPFSRNQADYQGVAPLLKSIRPSVTLFSSSGYINDMGDRRRVRGARLVGRHQHRAPARHRRQDGAEDPGADSRDRRRPLLRHDGHPGRRSAPEERVEMDQLHPPSRDRRRAHEQGVLCQSEQGVPQAREARTSPTTAPCSLSDADLKKMVVPDALTNDVRRTMTRQFTAFKTGF